MTQRKQAISKYSELKQRHPDSIIIFRHDEWNYEIYYADAEVASPILKLKPFSALINDEYVSVVSFSHRDLCTYLPKLVRAGKRVVICEQFENRNHMA